jgi:predicted RNA-binding protein YlqC (UPF0109 family)
MGSVPTDDGGSMFREPTFLAPQEQPDPPRERAERGSAAIAPGSGEPVLVEDDLDDELDDELDDDLDDDLDDAEHDDDDDDDDDDELEDRPDGARSAASSNLVEGGHARAVLEHVVRSLVDDPTAVVIDVEPGRSGLRMSVRVAPEDMGRVIGRRGRIAQAVRTLVRAAAVRDGTDASVDILD